MNVLVLMYALFMGYQYITIHWLCLCIYAYIFFLTEKLMKQPTSTC